MEQKFERLTARANMPKDIALGVNKQSYLFVIRLMFDIDLPWCDIESVDVVDSFNVHFPFEMLIEINQPFRM